MLTTGGAVFAGPQTGSAYELIGHLLLVAIVTVPALWSVGVMLIALARYWKDTHGQFRDLLNGRAWAACLNQSARMTHQTGAEEGCAYEENEPSVNRRRAHHLVMYGFLLTFVSTTSAAIEENFFGQEPPYPYLSVPVITGTVGGIMATIGCVVLIRLKKRSDAFQTTPTMRRADYGLLWALLVPHGLRAAGPPDPDHGGLRADARGSPGRGDRRFRHHAVHEVRALDLPGARGLQGQP